MIGGLIISWGQLDLELCSLFSRLLGFTHLKPPDSRAHDVFYSMQTFKPRENALKALANKVEEPLCRRWIEHAIETASKAADKRNTVVHSEYYASLTNHTLSKLLKQTPANRKSQVIERNGIRRQINDAIIAIDDTRFYLEFAYAATRGMEFLNQALKLYEPALIKRSDTPSAK
jgi:hypothetical protein